MAGFRTFATGEVLTAANVNNFLMGQSVMRFADADARTAALGTDVVEGMLTYNLATDQLEVFDGSAFVVAAPEPPAGIGSNVVQTVKTDTFATSSDTFVTVTGLSADITPTAASSKILVIVQITTGLGTASGYGHFGMLRGATEIYRGDALATNPRSVFGGGTFNVPNALEFANFSASMVFLDSPATAASTTYNVIARRATNGQALVNRSVTISAASTNSGASSITLIEVAA